MKGCQRVFGRICRETVALRKNENLEHNSSMIKNHKNKQNINREVNGNVNAAQNQKNNLGQIYRQPMPLKKMKV